MSDQKVAKLACLNLLVVFLSNLIEIETFIGNLSKDILPNLNKIKTKTVSKSPKNILNPVYHTLISLYNLLMKTSKSEVY